MWNAHAKIPPRRGILSPEEVDRLLRSASPDMLGFWAIGAFAGLRTAELQRLTWEEVNLEDSLIEVKAEKAKTASRRLVAIQPNLRLWLLLCDRSGAVCPPNLHVRMRQDRERAGFTRPWPNNALRHSFASYHLAAFRDAARLALEMGNSPRIIFRHYRELVRPVAANEFWQLTPPGLTPK